MRTLQNNLENSEYKEITLMKLKDRLSFFERKENKVLLLIICILIIGIIARSYKFGTLMDCVQSDEMGTGYDAWCLVNYGTDRYQKSWPVYFSNYGVHGSSALMAYLCALSFKIFGYGRFALRFPALVVSILAAVFGLLIIKEIFEDEKRKYQLVYAVLYAISPYTIMASRFALDCNLMFGISTIFLYFIIKAYQSENNVFFFLAGTFAGLTLYTYSISYIVMPVMLILSIIYMVYTQKVRFSNVITFVIPLFILATPLMLVQIINRYNLDEFRIGIFTIIRIMDYSTGDANLSGFLPSMLQGIKVSVSFDNIRYNTDPRFFTFYPMSVPFFLIGFVLLVKRTFTAIKTREVKAEVFVLLWILCEIMAGGIMTDPNVNRMNGIIFGVMYCITIGIIAVYDWLIKLVQNKSRVYMTIIQTTTCLFALSYFVYFGAFLHAYYTEIAYADMTTSSMCSEAFEFIRENDALRDKVLATNLEPQTIAASALPSPDKIDENGNYVDDHITYYQYRDCESLREFVYNAGGTDMAYLVYRPQDDDKAVFDELGASDKQFGVSFHLYYWE